MRIQKLFPLMGMAALAACASRTDTTITGPTVFANNPCGAGGTIQLGIAQTQQVDCSAGGTTLTFAGNGASYLIVPQFATNQGANQLISYSMVTGTPVSTAASRIPARTRLGSTTIGSSGLLPSSRPNRAQLAMDRVLRARGKQRAASGRLLRISGARQSLRRQSVSIATPPAIGSTRGFHVSSNIDPKTPTWKMVGAQLAYVGPNLLLYIDTLAPTNGFTPAQLQTFGQYFDQTLYPIDTAAFGTPSDLDQNGRVIMLLSPVVNALSPAATCTANGFVAGFFDPTDFDNAPDPNSNQGEIFYSVVPDPTGSVGCAHSVADLGKDIPATFLHELQHLINFSQHVVVSGGNPASDWMDEGLSIVAEELGSVYYEQKCPAPACRTNPAQLFPDSAQGFVQGFLYDSYRYALLPDTSSLTLHSDSDNGFSWRGGDWLLMRWLGDQMGSGFYKRLERGPSDGIADVEQATGQTFPTLFANFGLALHTDSLPGLPRTTAPPVNRFTSRNVKQLWARLYATGGPTTDIPLANPLQLFPITTDTSAAVMVPGTMTYFRLDTPVNAATITIRFSAPGGGAFPASLHPQLAIFRLPAGQ